MKHFLLIKSFFLSADYPSAQPLSKSWVSPWLRLGFSFYHGGFLPDPVS
jgi:hypothetical protein